MPKFTVQVRAPTVPCGSNNFLPRVNTRPGKFKTLPVFEVTFPDLGPGDLLELSVYVSATACITRQLDYPQHLSNLFLAFADAMKAASTTFQNGGIAK